MRIAILGGSFDPPHNGHVKIAENVLKKLAFDVVWLMPCFAHAFGKQLSPPQNRLSMARLLETSTVKISDFEIQKAGISISVETLEELAKQYPTDRFSWIIGSDQIKDFPKWDYWQEIISLYGLIIVKRDEKENLEDKTKKALGMQTLDGITFLACEDIPNISSTEIREKVKRGESIDALVPKNIEEYIKKHGLYK